ncbi:MAG: hypothetical protein Q7U82_12930 [Gammaproteobacteria bacterium]|nr:hypothetical protein [Gammaproteobacteria bacterium]
MKAKSGNPVEVMSDSYIRKLIKASRVGALQSDDIPQSLIEAKRAHLKLVRELRRQKAQG